MKVNIYSINETNDVTTSCDLKWAKNNFAIWIASRKNDVQKGQRKKVGPT